MFRNHDVNEQQSLFDAYNWMDPRTQQKLKESWAPIIYNHIYRQIDEQPLSVLYDSQGGAPNFPVRKLLTLEYIQHMLDVSDEEIYEMYNFDYRVSYALGQRALGEWPLSERTRYYFRERLYNYTVRHPETEDLIFSQFKALTESLCINAGTAMDEQRIDSTMFMSNIKKSGRISLALDVLVKGASKIPEGLRSETVKEILSPSYKNKVIYKAKASETESKLTILLRSCAEVLETLEQLTGAETTDEIRILKRLLREQATTDASGRLMSRPGKQVSPRSLQSAYDEEATYRRKGSKQQSGYMAVITETCSEENEVQFITDYATAPNVVSDVDALSERLDSVSETGCEILTGDGGFYSGEIISQANEAGITMEYTGMTGTGNEIGNLTAVDFTFNEANDAIRQCPSGQEPMYNNKSSAAVNAHFDNDVCGSCAMRGICPVKPQKKTAVVRFTKEAIQASQRRQEMAERYQANTNKRAAIEGTNSALKRKGMSKLRVRGGIKVKIVCGYKIMAQNIKRFVKYAQGYYEKKRTNPQPRGYCAVLSTE
jgi:hypothetical protein